MMRHKQELIAALFMLIVVAPALYHCAPIYVGTPDILYVKAKVLWVLDGALFTDPVTGYANFHPPMYHLILFLFVRLGFDIDTLLLLISISNVCLIAFFSYVIVRRFLGPDEAFWTVILFPFMITFMGFGNLFLASSFHFSVPFYLAGLWIYTKPMQRAKEAVLASFFWGLAFLISPVYFFLIGFTFAYELFIKRNYARFGMMTAVFVIMIIPFIIQAVVVYNAGMAGTATFALWRGIPDLEWLSGLAASVLSPVEKMPFSWPVIPAVGLSALGLMGMWKRRPIHPLPVIAALAYLFTAYHFSYQYAIRIHYFLSLFLVAYAVAFLRTIRMPRFVPAVLLCLVAGVGIADHFIRTERQYNLRRENITYYETRYEELRKNLPRLLEPGGYVLATAETYRYFLMPFVRVHGLVAYRSGDYFQLDRNIAREMLYDYNRILRSGSIFLIEHLCDTYGINVCVVRHETETDRPGFRTIALHWDEIYRDSFFAVYRRPTAERTP